MKKLALLTILLFVPVAAHAAVVINEVAWMGTSANANAEWVELANTGATSVDLTGWKLVAASGSPNITLSGTISAGGYFLLERTSDDTVPGVTADQIYTGALTNSGTTLTLSDASNTTIDTVVGGTNWANIGGDNTTKDTAQKTSTGWTTAAGTPRAANSGTASGSSSSGTTVVATSTATGASTYTPPPSNLSVDLSGDTTATLEVPAHFYAQVKTKGGSSDPAAILTWSFGDGSSGTGTSVEKTFHYPGTYLVTVRAQDGSAVATDEVLLTASVSSVKIQSVTSDGIILENDSTARLDLSDWYLFAGSGTFRMPGGTALLPRASMLFPNSITNLPVAFEATLTYPNRRIAAQYVPAPPLIPVPEATTTLAVQPMTPGPSYESVQTIVAKPTSITTPVDEPKAVDVPAAPAITAAAGAAVAPGALSGVFRSPWVLGFLGLLVASGGAFMFI